MAQIFIQGCKVLISDGFFKMGLDQQHDAIEKAAKSMGIRDGEDSACVGSRVIDFANWWLSWFGVHDTESTKLAITLAATAIFLAILYTVSMVVLMIIGGLIGLAAKS